MKKQFTFFLASALAMCCLSAPALAQSAAVEGTVVNVRPETIAAKVTGTVEEVLVAAGDRVQAGDVLMTLDTQKVYALESGTVRLFGETGDSAESVATRYGAVAFVEPDVQYTVSASTKNAYDAEANRLIHPGEKVYLRSVENTKKTGQGQVTTVSGTSYTVEVTTGAFDTDESVYVYRQSDLAAASRIGRGTVAHADPVAYTGTGVIAAFPVASGAHVKKGDVLFETVEAAFEGSSENLAAVVAEEDGVISSVAVGGGASVTSGGAAAEFYPDSALRIEALVSETDLAGFPVGARVRAEFPYLANGEYTVDGTVERVAALGGENADEADSEESWFTVTVLPDSTEGLFYGMHAVVSAADEQQAPVTGEQQDSVVD